MTDERWTEFYSKFIVIDESKKGHARTSMNLDSNYALIPTLIALIFLSQGNAENKAKTIGELFSEHSFYQPGIMNVNKKHFDPTLQGHLAETFITPPQLRCIVSIFVNLALVLLPLYAVDYPSVDNRDYLKNRCTQNWLYMSRIASLKEYAFMKALHERGFPTPTPIDANRHGIVMSLVRAYPMVNVRGLLNTE